MKRYLAIDIGASSGRGMLAHLEDGKIVMEEIHRFPNHPQKDSRGMLYWDVDGLFEEILTALKKAKEAGKEPDYIGIDTWGVDYVLIDEKGKKMGVCHCYRDPLRHRHEKVHHYVPFSELYTRTGIQFQPFNTIYQLFADQEDKKLDRALAMLMLPDYLNYRLTGVMKQEYCNATTTGLVNAVHHDWDRQVIDRLGYPRRLFLPLAQPGEKVGDLAPAIRRKLGFNATVVLPATHDTASAVLAVPLLENEPYISSGTWSLLGIEQKDAHRNTQARELNYSNEGSLEHSFRTQKNIMGLWMIQEVRHEFDDAYSFGEIVEMAKASTVTDLVDCNDTRFLSPSSMRKEIEAAVGRELNLGDMARIIYRSLANTYAKSLAELEDLIGISFPVLHITGGGGKNEFLNELTAKAIQRPVVVGPIEGTAIGNVLMQMIHSGEITSLSQGRQIIRDSFGCKEVLP
ncbi:MAG: rhamnulokinase [Bacilli bacterium]|nr:rhamnulokinase [Bacilli bacterium]MBO6285593.1 rhamnulokinase [Bacilli bacterium]